MIDFTDVLLLCLYNHDCLFLDRCDEIAQRKVEPINETCHSCLIFNWPRFLCTILLCQKSFLKVPSKWLLKNKSDNGKLLLGKTYSGERFRAILALLFYYPKSNPYYQVRQFKKKFFFSELCPFFNIEKLRHFVMSLLLLKIFT